MLICQLPSEGNAESEVRLLVTGDTTPDIPEVPEVRDANSLLARFFHQEVPHMRHPIALPIE
jgi:hypothetical protein